MVGPVRRSSVRINRQKEEDNSKIRFWGFFLYHESYQMALKPRSGLQICFYSLLLSHVSRFEYS